MSGESPTQKACPRCGTPNEASAVVCSQTGCGHTFDTPFAAPEATAAPIPEPTASAYQAPAAAAQPTAMPEAPVAAPPPAYAPPPTYPQAPPTPPYPPMAPVGPTKDRVVAGLLGILLGSLGIHMFYLGRTAWGIGFLCVTLLTCGFGAALTSVVGLIQGIMYLVATPEDFQQKYVVEQRMF